MKQRFTVRKHPLNKYNFCVWDRVENKVVRSYPELFSAKSLCKYMRSQEKKAVS